MVENSAVKKFTKFSQSQIPRFTLKESLVIAQALKDNFAAKSATPLLLAQAINRSPSSTDWRYLTGASAAYGLTTGGYNSDLIELTETGRKVVLPTEEGEDKRFLVKCASLPVILNNFYEKYNGNKFPREDIAKNVLVSLGVPAERVAEALKIVTENGRFVGILIDIKDGVYVQLKEVNGESIEVHESFPEVDNEDQEAAPFLSQTNPQPQQTILTRSNAIFLGHGKNRKPLEQLIKILDEYRIPYKEATAEPNAGRPISTKVADTMRECGAAILIFTADEKFYDEEGNEIWRPSENVVHELGAASILYDNRIVIFKEDGVSLSSNFSGIGYISFEKDKLSDKGVELFRELVNFKVVNITVGG